MMGHHLILGVLLVSFVWPMITRGETPPNDEQARAIAIDVVANATGISRVELNTRRLEDLEDDLFFSQRKIRGQIKKGAYFYRVENGGYQITPDEVTFRPRSARSWYIAVSTTDGEAFGLYGFKDANDGFQTLIARIPVEILNSSQAEIFAKFYLEAVYQTRASIVYDELRLKHNVEEHFLGYYDSQEPVAKKEQRFRRWWNGFKATRVAGPLEPTAKGAGDGRYLVEMKILEMTIGRPPELWGWSIEIYSNGTSHLLRKQPLFPTTAESGK